ncbi:TIGR03089 family protein [Zhihengliuella sp.]|uniref:TIGR03089 family protein n=1 Tax=Zhihengliuella sp. TaxID=1954483 RepID=UPI0028126F19|nr:TIGR03089 family protein [Zhihengliuella sp.]
MTGKSSSSDHTPFTGAEDVLRPLRASAAPLLVWHGAGGERVELSGRVFDNWVAKSANLLAEEYDVEPGTAVVLDLPPHWKSLALAFAAWQRGAEVRVDPSAPGDLLVTDRPTELLGLRADAGASGGEVLAVALGSLAPAYDGDLPPGAVDFAAEVRGYGDLCEPESTLPAGPSLQTADGAEVTYDELFRGTAPSGGAGDGLEERLPAGGGTAALATESLERALRVAVALFRRNDALVLFGRDRTGAGVEASQRLLDQEGATVLV